MSRVRRPELAHLKGDQKAYLKAYYRLVREERKGTERQCSRCGKTKPDEAFSQRNTQCNPCRAIIEGERYEHNKEQMRNRARERQFGLTPGQYQTMLEAQDDVCAICEQPETNAYNGVVRSLAVDHDHATGKVRGLLCAKCNTRLHADAAIDWFYRAAAYLQRHA
jgi:hypothetical protein